MPQCPNVLGHLYGLVMEYMRWLRNCDKKTQLTILKLSVSDNIEIKVLKQYYAFILKQIELGISV